MKIHQFGSEKDFQFDFWEGRGTVVRHNDKPYFEQIKMALRTDISIGTDSGSGLVIGAYGVPQVSLIPIHWGNEQNPTALSTNNPNNTSLYSFNGTDNITIQEVISVIMEKL